MTARERLTQHQIILLRSLVRRGAAIRAVAIKHWQRKSAIPLWRRGLLEIWYRQSPSNQPSLEGPYYGLTVNGAQLASSFL